MASLSREGQSIDLGCAIAVGPSGRTAASGLVARASQATCRQPLAPQASTRMSRAIIEERFCTAAVRGPERCKAARRYPSFAQAVAREEVTQPPKGPGNVGGRQRTST